METVQTVVLVKHQGTAHIILVHGVPALEMKRGVPLICVTVVEVLVERKMGMIMVVAQAQAPILKKGPSLMKFKNPGVRLTSLSQEIALLVNMEAQSTTDIEVPHLQHAKDHNLDLYALLKYWSRCLATFFWHRFLRR